MNKDYGIIISPALRKFMEKYSSSITGLGEVANITGWTIEITTGDMEEPPYMTTMISSSYGIDNLDIKVDNCTDHYAIVGGGWNTHVNIVNVAHIHERTQIATAAVLDTLAKTLPPTINNYKRCYPRCVEMIDRKYPWLAGGMVMAKHDTANNREELDDKHLFHRMKVCWFDLPYHQMEAQMLVRYSQEDEVVDVVLSGLNVGGSDDILAEVGKAWMMYKKLEAL